MSLEDIFEGLKEDYASSKSQEIDQGTTTVGPHRDDLVFYVNDRNVRNLWVPRPAADSLH